METKKRVHYSSPLHPRPAEGYLFFGVYMIVYEKKEIFMPYM